MKKNHSTFLLGMLLLTLTQIMVGVNVVFSKYVLGSIPILVILALRFGFATLILLPLHWLSPAKNHSLSHHLSKVTRKEWLIIFMQALCAGVFFNFLMLGGLHYTDANVAGIITSALPAIIALMSCLFLGESISGKKMVCVALACCGLMVIAYDKMLSLQVSHSFFGDLLVFASLIPEATYYILSKKYTISLPVFLASAILNGINAILLLLVLCFIPWDFSIHLFDWFILVILGLSAGLFYVFWYLGSQKVDGLMASLSTAIMPLATVMLAWLLLGEQLTKGETLGMSMVLLSIVAYAKR